ncbi:MAG: hypothetical protein JWP59_2671 [Massilia sp.]|nr:hypothetical protein [Massilia sp.]
MRMMKFLPKLATPLMVACALTCIAADAAAVSSTPTSTIIIHSRDPAGMGFNDPTPVDPVGGNPGTTLGEQRMFVYRYVADIWQRNLVSSVPIHVNAGWDATMACTTGSATLGSASANNIWYGFPNGKPRTWYPSALANKLAGVNLFNPQTPEEEANDGADIYTQFNARLGMPGCLDDSPFYLGIDGNAGKKTNFVETLLHELGHGLGFSVLSVYTATGQRINAEGTAYVTNGGLPSIWEGFMYDNAQGKTWLDMTSAQRRVSAITPLQLAWRGPNVAAAQGLLTNAPVLNISTSVAGASGNYDYAPAVFGKPITTPSSFGTLAVVPGQTVSAPFLGCDDYTAAQASAVRGKTAIVSRGVCSFQIKADKAQAAGATGLLLANNAAGTISASGSDANIPVAMVSQADGNKLIAAVPQAPLTGTRGNPGSVAAKFALDPVRIAGADAAGRPLLYTPNPLIGGSSVSHWDVSAMPNLLMEPNISPDLGIVVDAPKDLTLPLLKDIGW